MKTEFPDSLEDFANACVYVGSRITCNPPPTNTDQDILVWVDGNKGYDILDSWLDRNDWEYEGDEKYQMSHFSSWRKTIQDVEYNAIVTTSETWFNRFLEATLLCKKENAMSKKRRIEIFDSIMKPAHKSSLKVQIAEAMAKFQSSMQETGINNYIVQAPQQMEVNPQLMQAWYNSQEQAPVQAPISWQAVNPFAEPAQTDMWGNNETTL